MRSRSFAPRCVIEAHDEVRSCRCAKNHSMRRLKLGNRLMSSESPVTTAVRGSRPTAERTRMGIWRPSAWWISS